MGMMGMEMRQPRSAAPPAYVSCGRQTRLGPALPHLRQPPHPGQGAGTGRGWGSPGTRWGAKAKPELRDASHLDTAARPLPAGRAGLSLPAEEQEAKPRGEPTSPAPPWAARPDPTLVRGRWHGEQLQNHPAAASLRTAGQRGGAGATASSGFGTHRLPRGVRAGSRGFIQIPRFPLIPLEGITDKWGLGALQAIPRRGAVGPGTRSGTLPPQTGWPFLGR